MKKRVILIIFLLFPFIVNAETIPNQYDYDVITSEDTYIYDEDGQELTEIPAETELIIDSERYINDNQYGITTYENNTGYILLNKVNMKTKKINVNTLDIKEEKKIITLAETKIYKGPSMNYEELEEGIPKFQELTTKYYDDVWAYVDFNGVSGWIYTYTDKYNVYDNIASVGQVEKEQKEILIAEKMELYSSPITETKSETEVEQNQTYFYKYYYNNKGNKYIYIEKDNIKGWLEDKTGTSEAKIAINKGCNSLYAINNSTILYTTFNDLTSKSSYKILQGQELKVLYTATLDNGHEWYYVQYLGKKGWIIGSASDNTTQQSFAFYQGTSYKYRTNNDLQMYDNPGGESINKTIKKSTTFEGSYIYNLYGERWIYTEYDGEKGWIKGTGLTTTTSVEKCLEIKDSESDTIVYTGTEEKEEQNAPKQEVKKDNSNLIPKLIFVLIIIIGLVYVYIKKVKSKKSINKTQEVQNNGTPLPITEPVVPTQQPQPVVVPIIQQQATPVVAQPIQTQQVQVKQTTPAQPVIQQQTPVQNIPVQQQTVPATPVVTQPVAPVQPEVKIEPIDGFVNTVPIEDNDDFTPNFTENNQFVEKVKNDVKDYNNNL